MKKTIYQLLFCLFMGLYSTANAQWVQSSTGLSGSAMATLYVKDNAVWAGSLNGGLFVSIDSGRSWVNKGLRNEYINAVFIKDNQMFVGSFNGLFKSMDGGNTYTNVSTGLPSKTVRALHYRGNQLFVATDEGLMLSIDNGATWKEVNPNWVSAAGLPAKGVFTLIEKDSFIFAGRITGGLMRSTDGVNWTLISQSNGLTNGRVWSLAAKDGKLFVGTNNGLFLSSDNGNTLTLCNTGINTFTYALAVTPSRITAATNGQGIYTSFDNGATWTSTNNGLLINRILSAASIGNNVVVGTDGGGVYVSTDVNSPWKNA
jgi:ligand-binding sensor domain-containing protein